MENVCSIHQMYAYVRLDRSKGGVKRRRLNASDESREDTPATAPKPTTVEVFQNAPNPAFDAWLKTKLHELYEPVLREQIPDKLVQMIEAHQGNRTKNQEDC